MIDANLVTAHCLRMARTHEKLIENHGLPELHPDRIGRRLRIVREALGLKPSEMADTLGIERTYWSRFEGGIRPITPIAQALLRKRFGIPLEYVVLGDWAHLPLELSRKMRDIEKRIADQDSDQS